MTITSEGKIRYMSHVHRRWVTVWPINVTWLDRDAFSDGEWNVIVLMARGAKAK